MDNTIIIPIASILTQLGSMAALVISLFYLHNQKRAERIVSDDRWSSLKTESDNRWSSLKSENDNRWSSLKSENDERWLKVEQQILKIMTKLDMNRG